MTRRHTSIVIAFVVAVAFSAAACTPTQEDTLSATEGLPDTLQQLTAHVWILDPSDSSLTITPPDGAGPTNLRFDSHRTVTGQTACNTYRGPFAIDDDRVTIGPLAQTQRACLPQIMDAEAEYLDALQQVRAVDATDRDRLVLKSGSTRLAFTAQDLSTAIHGTWNVVNLNTGNALESVRPGTTAAVTFADDGQLSATGGCNPLTGTWRLDRQSVLSIELGAQGMAACTEPEGVMDQEAALTTALADAFRVEVADQLTIFDSDDHILLIAERAPAS
jgi:heat shock protein HslJ